jgi:MFS family permease
MTTPETTTLLLTLAFLAPLVFIFILNKFPDAFTKGQDAAGRGMAIGCLSIVAAILSALIAVAAAIVVAARHENLSLAWRIVGLVPIAASITTGIVIFISIQVAKARRIDRDYQKAMSIPAALIVDDDDPRQSRLYNALRPSFPVLEISLRHPGALYWQQSEWFPRLRVLYLSADAMLVTAGDTGQMTQDLLAAMSRMKPACPIVLHATTNAAADAITAKLSKAGWSIHPVIIDSDTWIKDRWQALAVQLLKVELEKRPAPTETA